MYEDAKILKGVAKLVLLMPLLILSILGYKYAIKHKEFNDEKETIHSGVIVEKKIVNPYNGLFTSHGTEYYIITETGLKEPIPFLNDIDDTKSFAVSEEVYLKYQVGDFFDSYNY